MRKGLGLVLVSSLALGGKPDPKQAEESVDAWITEIGGGYAHEQAWSPRLVIDPLHHHVDPSRDDWMHGLRGDAGSVDKPTIAVATDGTALWLAGDGGQYARCDVLGPDCLHTPPVQLLHVTALFDDGKPIVGMVTEPISDVDAAKAVAKGQKLPAFERDIAAAAADAARLFEASIADPKLLVASVSDRRDVVLFGSAPKETWIGGKTVRDQLAAWKFAFKVHDGIVAGTTASQTVAYVAANVDARPAGKPDAKPVPYRALFVYEKVKGAWQLVHAHFAFASPPA
jgi:hypothetical protein